MQIVLIRIINKLSQLYTHTHTHTHIQGDLYKVTDVNIS